MVDIGILVWMRSPVYWVLNGFVSGHFFAGSVRLCCYATDLIIIARQAKQGVAQ